MPKLPQGVTKRKDGLLEKRFTVNGRRVSVYGHTAKEIREKELEKRREIEESAYIKNKDLTVEKYFAEWIAQKKKSVKGSTVYCYKQIFENYIRAEIGSRKISEIEPREMKQALDRIQEKGSVYLANRSLKLFKLIFKNAEADEIIKSNPAEHIQKYAESKKPAAETIHRALTREEQAAFLESIKVEYYREFFELALLTGARCGELCALTWGDIDNRANIISISKTQTVDEHGKSTIGNPKTKTSRREIPLNAQIAAVIKRQRNKILELYGLEGLLAEKPVFVSLYGKKVMNAKISEVLFRIQRSMNENGFQIEHFSIHALRDTFATRYLEGGGTPQTLKTIMGHSSITITMDLYAHVLPNTKAEEMERISII